jgi:hypothetical protein
MGENIIVIIIGNIGRRVLKSFDIDPKAQFCRHEKGSLARLLTAMIMKQSKPMISKQRRVPIEALIRINAKA